MFTAAEIKKLYFLYYGKEIDLKFLNFLDKQFNKEYYDI
tara:strand:- start:117 stop:233 length:117 start_codon:yes stop_codon:yes gene_type:complete